MTGWRSDLYSSNERQRPITPEFRSGPSSQARNLGLRPQLPPTIAHTPIGTVPTLGGVSEGNVGASEVLARVIPRSFKSGNTPSWSLPGVAALLLLCAGSPERTSAVPPEQFDPLHATVPAKRCITRHVVELTEHRRSGVVSFWLDNGIRVHYRHIDQPPGQVQVTISLLGSEILETPETRGLSALAAGVLDEWAISAPVSVAAGAGSHDLHLDGIAGVDALQLRVWGSHTDMDAALRVASELLTRPHVDDAVLARVRAETAREIAERAADPRVAASDAMMRAIFPAAAPSARTAPLIQADIDRHAAPAVAQWLNKHTQINGLPIEVAIVGDLSLADALRLADKHLGKLPQRARVERTALAAERAVARPAGPIVRSADAGLMPEWSTVLVGCFGPDVDRTAELRVLRAAARVLGERLAARFKAENIPFRTVRPVNTLPPNAAAAQAASAQTTGAIGASVAQSAYTGMGLFFASADVAPADAARARVAMEEEIASLIARPPKPEELTPITEAMTRVVRTFDRDARYWSGLLSRADSLGIDADEASEGSAFYSALTGEMIRETLRHYWTPQTRIAITVDPKPTQ